MVARLQKETSILANTAIQGQLARLKVSETFAKLCNLEKIACYLNITLVFI